MRDAPVTTSASVTSSAPRTGGIIRFGSLAVALESDDPFWASVIPRRFRTNVGDETGVPLDVVLSVRRGFAPTGDTPAQLMRLERSAGHVRVASDAMTMELDTTSTPAAANLTVYPDDGREPPVDREHCFAVYVHKLLQLRGAVRLHGAAVECGGRTHVFLGDKGAGKSTIALALGRAGGRVLADDQIVIRKIGKGTVVSGCDNHIRLTEKSERHFLNRPLEATPQDFAGVMKKEVPLRDLAVSIPFEDRIVSRLYFPSVRETFSVRPVSRQGAAVRILDTVAPSHGFAGPADRWDLVQLISGFVSSLDCAEVTLSPDLREIDRLVRLVTE